MAEDMLELGLEGFDKLIDKYHDKAYDTATDGTGRIWQKVRLPGHRKSIYVEQNPQHGQEAQQFDPAKDTMPAGFKMDKNPDKNPQRDADNRARRDTFHEEDKYDRGQYNDRREPSMMQDRGYYDDNLDSPRKVNFNPFTEVRLTRPYPNEMPRDTYRGYPPPPQPQQMYYPPPPRDPMDDYGAPRQRSYEPDSYVAPAAAGGALVAQNQYRDNRRVSRDDSENRLDRHRSYDPLARRGYDDEDLGPPRRRRASSAAPRDDRRKSKDKGKARSSFAASMAGAVAGGFLGRSLGKGDFLSTTAGAVVGAVGGDILAEGGRKDRRQSKGGKERDRDKSRDGRKSYDYTYKDRY